MNESLGILKEDTNNTFLVSSEAIIYRISYETNEILHFSSPLEGCGFGIRDIDGIDFHENRKFVYGLTYKDVGNDGDKGVIGLAVYHYHNLSLISCVQITSGRVSKIFHSLIFFFKT